MIAADKDPGDASLREAERLFGEGRLESALEPAWNALRAAPASRAAKALLAKLLQRVPSGAGRGDEDDLLRLLRDSGIDPAQISNAGWQALLSAGSRPSEDAPALAAWLDGSALARALLEEAYVARPDAERLLTEVRRWLLVEGRWPDFPRLAAALAAQARHNGGAWLFDSVEEERLGDAKGFRPAYFPEQRETPSESGPDPVASQYEAWPYPQWSRVTIPAPTTLPRMVERLDPGGPDLPARADLLIAGCGTGREAAMAALRYPNARVTAIDVSETSLDYAREKCRDLPVDFRRLDLRDARRLGRDFDAIFCSGVLHHLPDPEAGWRALAEVLRPGGIMRVRIYSRLGRLKIAAAKAMIADLAAGPEDDALLRAVRRRLLDKAPGLLSDIGDFYTLAGLHDLLLNRHEDPFDIPRIRRALDGLGLRLIAMGFPIAAAEARYRREHPHDPRLRDLAAIAAFEQSNPFLFRSMYDIWCRAPAR
ncbi:MAG TPA: class I SAM-dependent methyltransferase [Allosphingosinicella sp.]|nr:class I SAM-dependent methyltransferase [Allosphingosinicella sp.]